MPLLVLGGAAVVFGLDGFYVQDEAWAWWLFVAGALLVAVGWGWALWSAMGWRKEVRRLDREIRARESGP